MTESIYFSFDGDDIGNEVARQIVAGDVEAAKELSRNIHRAQDELMGILSDRGADIIFQGGDNLMAELSFEKYDESLSNVFHKKYIQITGHSVSIGIGRTPIEAHGAIIVSKDIPGKGQTVEWNESMLPKLIEIQEREERTRSAAAPLSYDDIKDEELKKEVMLADKAEDDYTKILKRKSLRKDALMGDRGFANWISPEGKVFVVPQGTTHHDWVKKNFNVGEEITPEFDEYRERVGGDVGQVTQKDLLDAGWVRSIGSDFHFGEPRRSTIGIVEDMLVAIDPPLGQRIYVDFYGGSISFDYRELVETGDLADILRHPSAVHRFAETRKELKERVRELEELAFVDRLTGTWNRRFAEMLIDKEVADRGASLMYVDIDHFKKINDEYGHDKGDEVLKRFTSIVSGAIGEVTEGSTLARWGGEEFVVIVPDIVGSDHTADDAELIRKKIEERAAETEIPFTVSIGTARANPGSDPLDLVNAADRALYEAKEGGRNMVVSGSFRMLAGSDGKSFVRAHAGPDITPHVHKQDESRFVLDDLLAQGYDRCVWRLSTLHTVYDICDELEGGEYGMRELVDGAEYDAPLFSKSHPGCSCFLECYSTTSPELPNVNVSAGDTWE